MNSSSEVEAFFKWPAGQAIAEAKENRLPFTIRRGEYLFDLNRLCRSEYWGGQSNVPTTYKGVQK
jgi:hypothetical protein